MVMEDMPHSDDIIAVVTQRLQGDSDIAVRQEAKALAQFAAEPAQSVNEIDRRMLDKRYSWQRMNIPGPFYEMFIEFADRMIVLRKLDGARCKTKLQPLDVSTDESDLAVPDLNHAGAQRSGDGVAALAVAESARQVALVAKSHGNRSEVDEARQSPHFSTSAKRPHYPSPGKQCRREMRQNRVAVRTVRKGLNTGR